MPFLEVRDLEVRFPTDDGVVKAVDGLSFTLERGRTLGIVGESGSGKTVTGLTLLGLHDPQRTELSGHVWLEGTDLLTLTDDELNELRGSHVAMIFQDPLSALSPFYTIGNQIAEGYRRHEGGTKQAARQRAIELLGRVGIPQPDRRVDNYPHEFSGGMRQRAMIAMSLACNPALLVADEPTTALDVTVQAQILDLLADLQTEFNSAIILVTHDLGVISQVADDVLVMYAGRCVERGDVSTVLSRPQMPYTWGLLSSVPRLSGDPNVPLVPVRGAPPSLIDLPPGCPFSPRCDHSWRVDGDRCATERPVLRPSGNGSGDIACHLDAETRERIVEQDLLPLWEATI
jgi:peptide/nickel transport system ATP-binding protein